MANIKSAKKRVLVAEANEAKNKSVKSTVKTAVKKVDSAVAAGDKALAQANLREAEKELKKASSKGVYPKTTTSRKVSRLAKAVNAME